VAVGLPSDPAEGELADDSDEPLTLSDLRDTYYEATGTASGIVRQIAFAGLAFVWVFSGGGGKTIASQLTIPTSLVVVGLLLVITLTIDLVQYLSRSAIYGGYHLYMEKHTGKFKGDLPSRINWFPDLCFWLKALTLAAAYIILAWVLAGRIR